MFDFKYIMHHWRRMCDWYDEKFGDNCCDKCPLSGHNCGGIFEIEPDTDFESLAVKVDAWAKEFPEPVYPTWGEWFVSMGMLPDKWDDPIAGYIYVGCVPNLIRSRIPASVAQQLGIKPKEVVEGVL